MHTVLVMNLCSLLSALLLLSHVAFTTMSTGELSLACSHEAQARLSACRVGGYRMSADDLVVSVPSKTLSLFLLFCRWYAHVQTRTCSLGHLPHATSQGFLHLQQHKMLMNVLACISFEIAAVRILTLGSDAISGHPGQM